MLGHLFTQQRRQGDAIVERIRLIGEQRDRTRCVQLAQTLRAGGSRKAVSDDDVPPLIAQKSSREERCEWFD